MATSKTRLKVVAAAAAVGLFWSQAASAAPQFAAPVDPLVALSALGTAGSSSAVCGTSQASVDGCVLAMNDAAQPADTQAPPPEAAGSPTPAVNILPLLIALGVVVAVGAVLISGSDHGHGNLSPVSPA
jgi:hypothetical protein